MPVSSFTWTRAVTPFSTATADTVSAAAQEPTVRMAPQSSRTATSRGTAVEDSISTSATIPA